MYSIQNRHDKNVEHLLKKALTGNIKHYKKQIHYCEITDQLQHSKQIIMTEINQSHNLNESPTFFKGIIAEK